MYNINHPAILVCAIIAMVLGGVWYGPLFGRTWSRIVGANPDDLAARKEMQRKAMPLYGVQFILVILQVWVLAEYVGALNTTSGVINALWIWVAFIMPTIAASSMWNNDSAQVSWSRFLIQSGYQLILFIIFGLVLTYWVI